MKWLYRILRLFICPHKWVMIKKSGLCDEDQKLIRGWVYMLQCKYCGTIKANKYDIR